MHTGQQCIEDNQPLVLAKQPQTQITTFSSQSRHQNNRIALRTRYRAAAKEASRREPTDYRERHPKPDLRNRCGS